MSDHATVEVSILPFCDICISEDSSVMQTATVDGKTQMGPWAHMCESHFRMLGIGLGLGKGQRLVLKK